MPGRGDVGGSRGFTARDFPHRCRCAGAVRATASGALRHRAAVSLRFVVSFNKSEEGKGRQLVDAIKQNPPERHNMYIYNTSNQEMVERASPGEAKRSWIQGLSKGERRRHAADFARCLHVLLNWRTQDMLQKEATRFVVLTRAKCSYRLVCEVFFLQKFSIIF